MLKVVGIIILLISSGLMGYYISNKLSLRVDSLQKYLQFIKYIETEIRFSADLIYELIKKYKTTGAVKKFINEYCTNMEKGKTAEKSWETALFKISTCSGLKLNDIEIINNFGKNLGKNDIQGQIDYCNLTSNLINLCLKNAQEEKLKKGKLYFMLCFFGGACMVMILL